jgi:hypothetical protein
MHIISGLSTGGAETALYRLILNTKCKSYHHYRVISLTPGGAMVPLYERAGIKIMQLNFKKKPIAGLHKSISFIRKTRPDIVHTWMYHADLFGGLAAWWSGNQNIIWAFGQQVFPITWGYCNRAKR